MRSIAPKSSFVLALTGVFAFCGAGEVRALPLHVDRPASATAPTTMQVPALPGAAARPMADADFAVDELMKGGGQEPRPESVGRLVRLRPARTGVSAQRLLADVGALDATPDGRPIADVYDSAGAATGVPRPITPRKVVRRVREPQARTAPRPVEAPRAVWPDEEREWTPPEPPVTREPERPVRTNEALDLGIKTLDYIVMATRVLVEIVSRNFSSD